MQFCGNHEREAGSRFFARILLDPLDSSEVPAELAASKRKIGMGAVVCLASDARPINRRAWVFPIWSV